MNRYAHGGGAHRLARELGRPLADILDFSASINPLGMPPAVLAAARQGVAEAVHYPEIDAASLRAALALHHRLPPECLLPAGGSTELLYLAARALRPRRALLVTPAFSEYERALAQVGTKIDLFPLLPEEGFQLDLCRLLRSIRPDTDLVLLANPGNPTGARVAPEQIEALARAVREQALLAVDEAFVDFCPEASVIGRVQEHTNLYVFRSLTKFYAIPGLRAGYMAGSPRGIARLAELQHPWPLSTPALAAALACLGEAEFRAATLEAIPRLRQALAQGLTELGLSVFPSQANYLLARLEGAGESAAALAAALRLQGVLIRDCGNFPPLDGRHLRLAVRGDGENRRLLEALAANLAPPRPAGTPPVPQGGQG
jgi:threonine-phosphate decarboxylase